MQKLYIGADHRGFQLKESLKELLTQLDVVVVDCGASRYSPADDYPDFAFAVGERVMSSIENGINAKGILLCGSGIGMAIAANKVPGVTASLISGRDLEAAQDKREHNSNVLVLTADNCDAHQAFLAVKAWLNESFDQGRHLRRMNKIRFYEQINQLPYWTEPLVVPIMLMTEDKNEFRHAYEKIKQFAPIINIDIAEADFVGNNTLGADYIFEFLQEQARLLPQMLFTVHLMQKNPLPTLRKLQNLPNLLIVYVHQESDLTGIKDQEWSYQLALTFLPETTVTPDSWAEYDHVQFLTVRPGAQGNALIPEVFSKVQTIRSQGYKGKIHFDGAINEETLTQFLEVKPDYLNVGSAVVKAANPQAAYFTLVDSL